MKRTPSFYIATLTSLLILQVSSAHAEDWGDWSLENEQILVTPEPENTPVDAEIEPISGSAEPADSHWGDWEETASTEHSDGFEESPLSAREQEIFNELDNSNLSDYETSAPVQVWADEQPLLMQLEKLEQLHEIEDLAEEELELDATATTGNDTISFDSDDEIPEEDLIDDDMDTDDTDELYDEDELTSADTSIDEYKINEEDALETITLDAIDTDDLLLNSSDMTDDMDEEILEEVEFDSPINAVDAIEPLDSMDEIPFDDDVIEEMEEEMLQDADDDSMDQLPFEDERDSSSQLIDDMPFDDGMDTSFEDDLGEEVEL